MKTAYTLGDVRAARVVIVCEQCNRRGEYSTARLIEKFGRDFGMPDLKWELIICPELDLRSMSGCKAGYAPETRASWR